MFASLKWPNLRYGHAAMVWENRLTLLEAAIGTTVGLWDCRGRRWTARTENMGNGFGYIIKHHSFHWSPLCRDHTSNFHRLLLWLYLVADHLPSRAQLHHHLWLRHYAHHHLSLSLYDWLTVKASRSFNFFWEGKEGRKKGGGGRKEERKKPKKHTTDKDSHSKQNLFIHYNSIMFL